MRSVCRTQIRPITNALTLSGDRQNFLLLLLFSSEISIKRSIQSAVAPVRNINAFMSRTTVPVS